MRIALWSPDAGRGGLAALEPHLAREADLLLVGEPPPSSPGADLDVYHLADDPAHAYVYRGLLERPGVVVLDDWNLHRLVHAATAGEGDETRYRQEARRAHGELGQFVARQVAAGLGGLLPSLLLVMNDRVLDAGLAFVASSETVCARIEGRVRDRAVRHLPLAFQAPPMAGHAPEGGPDVGGKRPLVVAVRPEASPAPPWERDLRESAPLATVHRVREDDPALASHLAPAHVVVALEHPPRAGLGAAIPRAVAGGKPTLVSAGSGAAREMPEGVVARVSPGPSEGAETLALVRRLLDDASLRSRMGRLARTHARERHDPEGCARTLLEVVRASEPSRAATEQRLTARRARERGAAARAMDEIAVAARELGVSPPDSDVESLTAHLFGRTVR
jgi:hypothetical protein